MELVLGKYFRAIKGAVSLKPKDTSYSSGHDVAFPRHQRRGLIEAWRSGSRLCRRASYFRAIKGAVSLKRSKTASATALRQYFRAIKGAVSLKRFTVLTDLSGMARFPRHQRRGLIEA